MLSIILKFIPRPLLIRCSYWVKPIIALLMKGNRYMDPIDQKTYRKFLPYGYKKKRSNVLAPGTLSLERHRLLWVYLKNKTDFFTKDQKVLHIAPEQCFYERFKKQSNLDYLTLDLSSPLAHIKADICDLPLDDNSFDVIFCNHVLEHISDDIKAMKELFRVMKPGGFGVFQVPQDTSNKKTYEDFSITNPRERTKHFGQYDHVRIYGMDYFDRLKSIGFKVKPILYAKEIGRQITEYYRLSPCEILPICKKPL